MSEATTNEATNVLEELSRQFKTAERIELDCEEILTKLFSQPCNLEEKLRVISIAQEENPAKRASSMAAFLCSKIETETGQKAFRNCNNEPAAKVLRTSVDPDLLINLFSQVAGSTEDTDEEELVGKSDKPDAAS